MSSRFLVGSVFCVALIGCGDPTTSDPSGPAPITPVDLGSGASPLDIPLVEDNVRHDTLFVDATFDLRDGSFMMVARAQRETFEGLRLHQYTAGPDSSAKNVRSSAPGYDSWTMLPTFFRPEAGADMIILANFGERQSWGQKVMRFGTNGFTDLGFLDVAIPVPDAENGRRLENAGPKARISGNLSDLTVTFDTDSLYLYDDLKGRNDLIVPGKSVGYRLKGGRTFLIVDGEEREVKQPA